MGIKPVIAALAASLSLSSAGLTPLTMQSSEAGNFEVTDATNSVRCELSYDTRAGAARTQQKEEEAVSPEVLAAYKLASSLTGKCVDYDAGGFIYQVCLGEGGRVQQRGRGNAADQWDYKVGTFDAQATAKKASPAVAIFKNGDKCGEPEPYRQAEVRLHCGESFRAHSAEEPQKCSYVFDVSHPDLCEMLDIFPRFTRPMGGQAPGSENVDSSAPLDLVESLPASARNRVMGHEDTLRSAQRRAEEAQAEHEQHATTGLSEQDVAGAGGKTIGLDDRERHGGRWTGVLPGHDRTASWAVGVQPTWGDDEEAGSSSGGGVLAASTWTCTALATDDLRKGTEGAAADASSGAIALRALSMKLQVPGTATGRGVARVVSASARSAGRQVLDVEVAQSITKGGAAKGGVASHVVTVAVKPPAPSSSEGAGNEDLPIDVAFITVTLSVEEQE